MFRGEKEKIHRFFAVVLDLAEKAKVVRVYSAILIISILILIISFVMTNRIAENTIIGEYTEYSDTIYEQTYSDINRGLSDLMQIAYSIMSDTEINLFLSAETFPTRFDQRQEVVSNLDRICTVQKQIQSIYLYNREGTVIINTGTFIKELDHMSEEEQGLTAISFGGPYEISGNCYFSVIIPMFSVKSSIGKVLNGYCSMILGIDFLEERLPDIFSSGEEWCIITTKASEIILEEGIRPAFLEDSINLYGLKANQVDNQFLYEKELDKCGWHLIFSTMPDSFARNINRLQKINIVTSLFLGILILLLFIGIYAGFLRPIRRQIEFMNYYAVKRKSRMEIHGHNEMSILAENLNHMLDELEELNEKNIRAREQILEAEYQKKQSELLAYRNQINPHFLNNTFECIRGMALYYDVPDIAAISESLASFFSYSVRGKGYAQISEIGEHIRDYAAIIGYRFMNKYEILWEAPKEVETLIFPKMIIQPLVENAIFHGLETVGKPGRVLVSIDRDEENLHIRITDSGCGMTEEELAGIKGKIEEYQRTSYIPPLKHGIGLLNILRRLGAYYGEDYHFTISSKEKVGTGIEITVPVLIAIDQKEKKDAGFFN